LASFGGIVASGGFFPGLLMLKLWIRRYGVSAATTDELCWHRQQRDDDRPNASADSRTNARLSKRHNRKLTARRIVYMANNAGHGDEMAAAIFSCITPP
jgi:hypothetical protein